MGATIDQNDRYLFKNDVTRQLRLLTGINLAFYAAADLTCRVRRPDATYISMTVSSIENAANGIVIVQTATDNLNQVGQYIVQLRATVAGQPNQVSDFMDFYVDDRMSGL